jgi:hypothetical protein
MGNCGLEAATGAAQAGPEGQDGCWRGSLIWMDWTWMMAQLRRPQLWVQLAEGL